MNINQFNCVNQSTNAIIFPFRKFEHYHNLNFKGKNLQKDTFEKRSFEKKDNIKSTINKFDIETKCKSCINEIKRQSPGLFLRIKTGEEQLLRKVQLKNRKTGKYENAYITQHQYGMIFIYNNDKIIGSVILKEGNHGFVKGKDLKNASKEYQNNDFLEIENLETDNKGHDASELRGIGTELLKQAVIESYRVGHSGRIALAAGNFTHEGRDAEGFYNHIGLTLGIPYVDFIFVLPENKINEFLKK